MVQKGIYINKNIAQGEKITDEFLIMKRPVGHLSALYYDFVIGRKVNKDIVEGGSLNLTDLDFE